MSIERAYFILYMVVLCCFALLITVMLIRAVKGPRMTDRVLAVNMIGTMVICCIAILSVMLSESYLVDVALIYAMISFVSVLILISVYLPKRKLREMFDGQNADSTSVSPVKKKRKKK
ncbi:MAG: sodium:proton antiporter [Lachnospiraceae bacterium]|nr:sodium:proton antiporter [Lachnospiraceae bacterium]